MINIHSYNYKSGFSHYCNLVLLFKKLLIYLLLVIPSAGFSQTPLTQLVNPFIGTGGHGHTFPGATLPFGMVQLSPDTRIDGSWDGCGGYHYSDSVIYGFTHTHLSGTGISDYGDILLMPTTGTPVLVPIKEGSYKKGYASHFSHKRESASPGFYAVHLDDDGIDVSLTTSGRVGMHQYSFPASEQSNIILDLAHRDEVIASSIQVIDARHVQGMRRSKGWAPNQVVYFAIEFSKQFNSYGISLNDSLLHSSLLNPANDHNGKNIKAFFQFNTSENESIIAKVGISAVSMQGARNNLLNEIPDWNFEEVRINAEATWNYYLSKIEVKGGTANQQTIFYTALYHSLIAPNLYSDADGSYLGRDGQIHAARHPYYTVFSLWDTYRALHPLLTIITPKQNTDFIKTMLLQFEQGGRLPVWELSANETDCMIGYHSVSVIADAAAKGLKGFDYRKALDAMQYSAGLSIYGLAPYREKGYISMEDEGESVSKTLEYAYDDWCIAQLALRLNDSAAFSSFIQRAQSWKNLFDPATGFLRPKKNGSFLTPFDPYEVNFNYTEANSWQYRFAVQQDIEGLKQMLGGTKNFEAAIDSLFTTSSKINGREQPDITGMIGQYAHGNEPSHHMAYLYNYAGNPAKTQAMVHKIMEQMYHNAPDGLSGNEDCGQMSAWYVFSAMGFYPVTPGTPYYAIGTPLFDTVRIHLDNQKTFTIVSKHAKPGDIYIQSMKLNGTNTDTFYISQEMILKGSTVSFEMGSSPATFAGRITAPPSAITQSLIAVVPAIEPGNATFRTSATLSIKSPEKGSKIYYTLDNSTPTQKSKPFLKPFTIKENTVVKAIAVNKQGVTSKAVTSMFQLVAHNSSVTYLTRYNDQYIGGGDLTLIDGQQGGVNFKNGYWQGWWGMDMEVLIDLQKTTAVTSVSAGFLQDQKSWILMPKLVNIEGSDDGKNYYPITSVVNDVPYTEEAPVSKQFSASFPRVELRYVKIKAVNAGKLQAGHPGAGGDSWIFCDEITVR